MKKKVTTSGVRGYKIFFHNDMNMSLIKINKTEVKQSENMKGFFEKHSFLMKICVMSLAVILFCGVFAVMGWGSLLHKVGSSIIYPFQWTFGKIGDACTGFVHYFSDVDELQDELDALKAENESLRAELADAQILMDEHTWLYAYLSMKYEHEDYAMCSAAVIATDTTLDSGGYMTGMTLNKGSAHGIERGMPVVGVQGLIGMVTEVSLNHCFVQTVLNTSSSVGALVTSTGDTGLLEGDFSCLYDGQATLRYLPEDAGVAVGDMVVTSGEGSVYPYGIPIGRVSSLSVNAYSRTLEASVTPLCDFSNIKNVVILTSYTRYAEGAYVPEYEEESP